MKKIWTVTLCAIAAAAALVGCSRKEDVPQQGREVRFTTRMETYGFTKATESALEEGDQIQIIAGAPINAIATATVTSDQKLTLSSPIYWVKDQAATTDFVAIYPANGQTSATLTTTSSTKATTTTHTITCL